MRPTLAPATWNIKTKSLALFSAYLLGLLVVYVTLTTLLLRRESADVLARLEQTGRILGAEIDAYLESGRERLRTVAGLPGLVYGLAAMRDASAGEPFPPSTTLHYLFFRSSVFTGGVLLADRAGTVLWTEPPGRPWLGAALASYPPVATTLATGAEMVSPALGADALLSSPHVVVTAPIAGPDGEVAGVLAGVIELTASGFTKNLSALSASHRGRVQVVDDQDRVVASTDHGELLARFGKDAAADMVMATSTLTQAPWRIVTCEDRATARAEVWRLQRVLLAIGVGGLLLAAAVGWPLIGGFVRDVNALTADAARMARGDLSRPVVIGTRRDELAVLARTFDRMRRELARSQGALEQRLVEREELIRLKEEFLANVSHELRTPLNVIIGYSDMLHAEDPDDERRAILARLRAQAEHLFQLVQDLMTLSGLNTGKIALHVQPLDPRELAARLGPVVDHLRASRDVAFRWEIAAGLPPLETDVLRLEQALSNLITNAFKFTTAGEVEVAIRHDAAASRILFEVRDTGPGIPAEDVPHIFDEFRQVDGSMHRHHGGMGLGLALVRRLADLLGGEIAVASTVGRGSTFTLALAVRAPAPEIAADAAQALASG